MAQKTTLKRRLNISLLILYGLGTTIGAGIYALIGEVAGTSGLYAPLAFFVAAVLAGFTAISFAEMSGRFPGAAGSALFVLKGFGSVRLSTLVGLLVIFAGITSASALTNAFVGYLHQFIGMGYYLAILLTVLMLGVIAAIGILESVVVASVITVIEIFGLILVVGVNYESLALLPDRINELVPPIDFQIWGVIFAGAILAFYAFLGFEDMVVLAEEVKDVRRVLPLAILTVLGITTVLYLIVMTTAVLALPPGELMASEAPLSLLYRKGTGNDPMLINAIAVVSIINGALIQLIMASRLLYGLGSENQIHTIFSYVSSITHTPLIATALVTVLILLLSVLGTLKGLAEATSLIMLIVFALVNLSAWRVKHREPMHQEIRLFPKWIPLTGFFVSTGFALYSLFV
ncbi:MAG: APC family permease [Desulfobulbia bacterium]